MRPVRAAVAADPAFSLHYDRLETPVGPVWVAASSRGVARVALAAGSEARFLDELRRRAPGHALARRSPSGPLERALSEIDEYFRGHRRRFDLPLDLDPLSPFARRVLEATAAIPYGEVVTYGELARSAGRPGAARAVGSALGSNPVPILVPCHRVVAAGGELGGFSAGEEGPRLKRRLLAAEGVRM